jgi:hypothetical protein
VTFACSRKLRMATSNYQQQKPNSSSSTIVSVRVRYRLLQQTMKGHSRVERAVTKIRQAGTPYHKPTNDPAIQVLVDRSGWRPVETSSQAGDTKPGTATSRTAYGARVSCYQTQSSPKSPLVHEFRHSVTSTSRYRSGSGLMNTETLSSSSWSPSTDHGMRRTSKRKQRTKPSERKSPRKRKQYVMKNALQKLARQQHNARRLRPLVRHCSKCTPCQIIKMCSSRRRRHTILLSITPTLSITPIRHNTLQYQAILSLSFRMLHPIVRRHVLQYEKYMMIF